MRDMILTKDDIYKGNLILVNADYPSPDVESTRLVQVDAARPGVRFAQKAASMLRLIFEQIGCAGKILPVSGYRSRLEQARIYSDSLRENGAEFTKKYVALPGCSEHQTGLAIDLALKKDCIHPICPDFPDEGICGVFRQNAHKYGLIERYQRGKEAITGIAHEPWHFRYVGDPHAEIMGRYGFVLEEYIDFLRQFPRDGSCLEGNSDGKGFTIYFVPLSDNHSTAILLPDDVVCEISGNNADGCIVTEWRDAG